MTMQEASRRTGLSGLTLRYYEEVGLIGPIARADSSGHRRYTEHDVDDLLALACLRAMGVGIEDMRTYQNNRARGAVAGGVEAVAGRSGGRGLKKRTVAGAVIAARRRPCRAA
jgi:DNA-binding transcriptional MerR regulator